MSARAGREQEEPPANSSRKRQREEVEGLMQDRRRNTWAEHLGPRQTLSAVAESVATEADRVAFIETARVDAILGACGRSMPSLRSGVRAYIAYVDTMRPGQRRYFPPELDILLSWSTLFRCKETFSNYVGYVRTACLLVGVDVTVFQQPGVRRAKAAICKRKLFQRRERRWIQAPLLMQVLSWCRKAAEEPSSRVQVQGDVMSYALLYLVTYVFMLRLPSEALPLRMGNVGGQACIYREDGELVVKLARRLRHCHIPHPHLCRRNPGRRLQEEQIVGKQVEEDMLVPKRRTCCQSHLSHPRSGGLDVQRGGVDLVVAGSCMLARAGGLDVKCAARESALWEHHASGGAWHAEGHLGGSGSCRRRPVQDARLEAWPRPRPAA